MTFDKSMNVKTALFLHAKGIQRQGVSLGRSINHVGIGLAKMMLMLACWSGAHAASLSIKTAAQDSAPKYIVADGQLNGGICPDILRAIEQLDRNIEFTNLQQILPFKRLEEYLWSGKIDMFCGYLKSPAREGKVQYVTTPIYTARYQLAVRSDDLASAKVRGLEDLRPLGKDGLVLAMFGTAPAAFLLQQGILVDEGAQDVVQMLNKLVARRANFAYYYDLGFESAIEKAQLRDKVRVLPAVIQEIPQFIAFNNQADPAKIKAVSDALVKLHANGTLAAIYKKYAY